MPIEFAIAILLLVAAAACWLWQKRKPLPVSLKIIEVVFNDGLTIRGEIKMIRLFATQTVSGRVVAVDAKGNEAAVQDLKFSLTNPIGTVEAVEGVINGFKFTPTATGITQLIIEADADLGEGVESIQGLSEEIEVLAGKAVSFTVAFDAPVEA